jgi:hypothetical protein
MFQDGHGLEVTAGVCADRQSRSGECRSPHQIGNTAGARACRGVAVPGRWRPGPRSGNPLAEARIGDCLSAFSLPHWMMALAATGRHAAAYRMLEAMRGFAHSASLCRWWDGNAVPVCEAVQAYARGQFAQVMRPTSVECIAWAATTRSRTCWSSSVWTRR